MYIYFQSPKPTTRLLDYSVDVQIVCDIFRDKWIDFFTLTPYLSGLNVAIVLFTESLFDIIDNFMRWNLTSENLKLTFLKIAD